MQQCKIPNYADQLIYRLLLISVAFCGALLGLNYIKIPGYFDPSFLLVLFAILSIIGWLVFSKIIKDSVSAYIILQSIFFWILLDKVSIKFLHIPYKPESLIFGFALIAGIYFFFKNFNYLWKFTEFKFFTVFLLVNIIYYFLHSSGFNISLESIPYGGGNAIPGEKQAAKIVVFLSSLSVFLSSVISLSVFKDINSYEQIKNLILKLTKIFSFFFFSIVIFLIALGQLKGLSFHLCSFIYFAMILTFKYYLDNFYPVSRKFSYLLLFIILSFFSISVLVSNKASIMALLTSLSVYLLFIWKDKYKFKTFEFLEKGTFRYIFISFIGAFILFLGIKFGIVNLIIEKVSNTLNGISNAGINSLYIRKNNWLYFMHYWQHHLDLFKTLFGFGLGKSREAIFYISAAQYSSIYRVQTVHNQYMEMFFDYGLMAMFYYLPFITIFFKNIMNIFNKNIPAEIKLFSNMSIMLIIFYFVYHLADGLRVTTAIIFFSVLIFIEGLNVSLKKHLNKAKQEELNLANLNC